MAHKSKKDATVLSQFKLVSDRRWLAVELARIKHRAGQLGLWRTMQALDTATTLVGWEVAQLEQELQCANDNKVQREVSAWECADCGIPLLEKSSKLIPHHAIKNAKLRICSDRKACQERVRSIQAMTGTSSRKERQRAQSS